MQQPLLVECSRSGNNKNVGPLLLSTPRRSWGRRDRCRGGGGRMTTCSRNTRRLRKGTRTRTEDPMPLPVPCNDLGRFIDRNPRTEPTYVYSTTYIYLYTYIYICRYISAFTCLNVYVCQPHVYSNSCSMTRSRLRPMSMFPLSDPIRRIIPRHLSRTSTRRARPARHD